jgi:hypothetical protein
MPRRTHTPSTPIRKPRSTRLQKEERRNQRKNLDPPAGVQIVSSFSSRQSQKSKALNDLLDQLQDFVPSFTKGSKLTGEPSASLCLDCIPDAQARKYLQKYGDNIDWDGPCDSDFSDSDSE